MVEIIKSDITKVKNTFAEVRNQYFAFFIVNFITIAHGATMGWLSPIILILQSDQSPFDSGPVTNEQISWLGSVILLGGLIGSFSYAAINNYFGRKISMITMGIPSISSWIIVIVAPQIEYLYAARFLAGITGGGVYACIPMFISEVASDHVRGSLSSFFILTMNFGTLFTYITGPYVPYIVLPYIILALPIIFTIGTCFLPDVPLYLMKSGKNLEAEKSIRFYQNCKNNSKEHSERFEMQMKKIEDLSNKRKLDEKISLRDFWVPEARRGILNGFTIMIIYIFTGPNMFLTYSAIIFAECGSNFDPNLSAIIMIVLQLIGIYVSIFIADRFNRKTLMSISTGGGTIGLFSMGMYIYLYKQGFNMTAFDWVPVTSLSFAVFFFALGLMSIGLILIAEVLPSKVRPVCATLSAVQMAFTLFLLTKFFPILYPIIGMHSCMWIFAAVALCGVLYSIFILPETKGKNINSS